MRQLFNVKATLEQRYNFDAVASTLIQLCILVVQCCGRTTTLPSNTEKVEQNLTSPVHLVKVFQISAMNMSTRNMAGMPQVASICNLGCIETRLEQDFSKRTIAMK